MIKRIAAVTIAVMLTGCAHGLYQWGDYEDNLYKSYKDPTQAEKFRIQLEAQIQSLEQAGKKVAPGLYAELGTAYLQAGDKEKAIQYYKLERQTWSESTQLMTAMITNLERLGNKAKGDK